MDINTPDADIVEIPFEGIVRALALRFHIKYDYFFWALEILCYDMPYEGSLYRHIAVQHGLKQGTIVSSLALVPERAMRFAPEIYVQIIGSQASVFPLMFLERCANWIKSNTDHHFTCRVKRGQLFI